jgi:hypothetical protein
MNRSQYTLTIIEKDLRQFLCGIVKTSDRETVLKWLKQMKLNWESYWEVYVDARAPLIAALLYTNQFPSLEQITKIILEEKRHGPRSAILKSQNLWWSKNSHMQMILKKFYANLTQDQFLWLFKLNGHNYTSFVIEYCNPKLLPLVLGQGYDTIITNRLAREQQ